MIRFVAIALSLGLSAAAAGGPVRFQQSGFKASGGESPEGWTVWSARSETAPRTSVDLLVSRGEPGSLVVAGGSNAAEHGGWERSVSGVRGGSWYRFTAFYRASGVAAESLQIVPRIDWKADSGKRAGQPDYPYQLSRDGEWTRVKGLFQAPQDASSATLQFFLSNSPLGTVWWDEISFEETPDPGARKVRVASVNLRPGEKESGRVADSVGKFIETIDKTVPKETDVILLPEGITVVGTGKSYADVADTVPGKVTGRLGEVARKHGSWLVAGIYEREGNAIYNTAVLLDRAGRLAGKYRKVYLPREEIEAGLTPGNDYPVFRTDFGTVGMMICYDVFFADPARALALRGAELILMPIWGGDETLGKARAIENKVFIASSGYDYPTYVMDPDGELLALARDRGETAVATIDLNRRYTQEHLGEMHSRRMKELRVDVPMPVPGLGN